MALPRKYILFIMHIVGLGRPALFANEVHKFTHTHTSNIYIYIYIYIVIKLYTEILYMQVLVVPRALTSQVVM